MVGTNSIDKAKSKLTVQILVTLSKLWKMRNHYVNNLKSYLFIVT